MVIQKRRNQWENGNLIFKKVKMTRKGGARKGAILFGLERDTCTCRRERKRIEGSGRDILW